MKYFRDSTDPAYREYCAEIVGLQKRFTGDRAIVFTAKPGDEIIP